MKKFSILIFNTTGELMDSFTVRSIDKVLDVYSYVYTNRHYFKDVVLKVRAIKSTYI